MKEKLLSWGPLAALATFNPLIYILIIAMLPIVELRGAIPVGINALSLPWWQVFLVSFIGSLLPAPLVILFFEKFLSSLKKKHWLPKLTKWLDKKFSRKAAELAAKADDGVVDQSETKKIKRMEAIKFWGVVVFVAIPLPGTGVWTASGIASLIQMPFRKALAAVALGDLIAGVIVLALSVGGKLLFS